MAEDRILRGNQLLSPEAVKKDNCRSYAGVYKRRGIIKQECCEWCGSLDSQMHHEDYDTPTEVTWLCQPCHQELHNLLRKLL